MNGKQRQITLEGEKIPTRAESLASKEFANKLMWALTAPIITTPTTVSEVTSEQHEKARLNRLIQLASGKSEEATDYEAMLYLSNFTLEQPPDDHTMHIYSYLFNKLYPEHAKEIFGDEAVIKLDFVEEGRLKELKRAIYQSQQKHLKAKLR